MPPTLEPVLAPKTTEHASHSLCEMVRSATRHNRVKPLSADRPEHRTNAIALAQQVISESDTSTLYLTEDERPDCIVGSGVIILPKPTEAILESITKLIQLTVPDGVLALSSDQKLVVAINLAAPSKGTKVEDHRLKLTVPYITGGELKYAEIDCLPQQSTTENERTQFAAYIRETIGAQEAEHEGRGIQEAFLAGR